MVVGQYGYYVKSKKPVLLDKLKPKSNVLVQVRCPSCNMVRTALWYHLTAAGHHKCLQCVRIEKHRKHLQYGTRSGRLIVIGSATIGGRSICKCECGFVGTYYNYAITKKTTKSCGCLRVENIANVKNRARGKSHGRWRGGISGKRNVFMQTLQYKQWRVRVFDRDSYTCKKCGQVGQNLNAHHIIAYADNKFMRLDVNNGITFCSQCHKNFHRKYGRKGIGRAQLLEFLQGVV